MTEAGLTSPSAPTRVPGSARPVSISWTKQAGLATGSRIGGCGGVPSRVVKVAEAAASSGWPARSVMAASISSTCSASSARASPGTTSASEPSPTAIRVTASGAPARSRRMLSARVSVVTGSEKRTRGRVERGTPVAPPAGTVAITRGGTVSTVSSIDRVPELPARSQARAMTVFGPSVNANPARVKPPLPSRSASTPFTVTRSVPWTSLTVPVTSTAAAASTAPAAGLTMRSVGADRSTVRLRMTVARLPTSSTASTVSGCAPSGSCTVVSNPPSAAGTRGRVSTVTVTAWASLAEPRTTTVPSPKIADGPGSSTTRAGGVVSRSTVRVSSERLPARSTAATVTTLAPSCASETWLWNEAPARAALRPATVTSSRCGSSTVPANSTVAAPTTAPSVGAVTAITGGAVSSTTESTRVRRLPASSSAAIVIWLAPSASASPAKRKVPAVIVAG